MKWEFSIFIFDYILNTDTVNTKSKEKWITNSYIKSQGTDKKKLMNFLLFGIWGQNY